VPDNFGCRASGISQTNLDQHMSRLLLPIARAMMQASDAGALPGLYAALGEDINGGDYCGPSGFRKIKGPATKVKPRRHALHEGARRKLRALSEELTGVAYKLARSSAGEVRKPHKKNN
jgi:hypothetical protein